MNIVFGDRAKDKMEKLAICRICLNNNVQHIVKNLLLQEIYERLTTIPFQSDMRPLAVCYICYAQLRASLRFKLKCLWAEQLLAQMLDQRPAGDEVLDPIQVDPSAHELSITSVVQISIDNTEQNDYLNCIEEQIIYDDDVKLEAKSEQDIPDTGETACGENLEIDKKVEMVKRKRTRLRIAAPVAKKTKTELNNTKTTQAIKNENLDPDNINAVARKPRSRKDIKNPATKTQLGWQTFLNRLKCQRKIKKSVLNRLSDNNGSGISSALNSSSKVSSSKKTFVCDVCDKVCHTKHGLRCHSRTHSLEKPLKEQYNCKVCGKSLTQKGSLKKHLMLHTGERKFICDNCGKRFNDLNHFKNHLRVHTGERPFICDYCKKGFKARPAIIVHMRSHTGERPYACGVCEKSFIGKEHLKRHALTHTGEKPYVCPVCDKGFNQKGNLKTHSRIHTNE